jgi:hypothetical protein
MLISDATYHDLSSRADSLAQLYHRKVSNPIISRIGVLNAPLTPVHKDYGERH